MDKKELKWYVTPAPESVRTRVLEAGKGGEVTAS
jgi:hypothetical protein